MRPAKYDLSGTFVATFLVLFIITTFYVVQEIKVSLEAELPVTEVTTVDGPSLPNHEEILVSSTVAIASTIYGYTEDQITAQIMTESSFNPDAVSSKGAIGYMQVRPQFWKEVCNQYDVYNKYENILVGVCIMRYYQDKLGNYEDALVAYNIGITSFNEDQQLVAGFRYRDKVLSKLGE